MQFFKNLLDKKGNRGGGDDSKKGKKAQSLLIMLLLGVLLLLASNYFANRDEGNDTVADIPYIERHNIALTNASSLTAEGLAQQMEEILSQIAGAGEVRVMLTFGSSSSIYAQNIQTSLSATVEEDGEGGTRNIDTEASTHTYVMMRQPDGSERPLRIQEILPQVEGVIVVAAGAGDIAVRDALVRATHTLLGIGSHRVQVFQMATE
ncbi:MAG: hypothetical protein FWE44_04560 [Defluviitaleaceae bacterium]|nr:hypothetical protein [Defluviitaleaceae bacterium]